MAIIHSSDLGWKAGQDISSEFAAVAKTLQPGDTFVFDHMYDISGSNIQLANNVTLAGGAPGAGIDIQDVEKHDNPLLILSDSNKFVDMTVKHGNTSDAFANNKSSIVTDGDDIQIINSAFEGHTRVFVYATGDSLSVIDTVFDGAYYQMRWHGEATNFLVENSLFQNSLGDGIKTARHKSGEGTQNATVSNSVFMNNARDGIDTTGGFSDSVIIDSYFINNAVAALDFKKILEHSGDLTLNQLNTNINITNTIFSGPQKNMIVTTLLDRGDFLDTSNVGIHTPNNIHVSDSIFENHKTDGGFAAPFLTKDAHSLTSTNNLFLGKLHVPDDTWDSFSSITGTTTGAPRTQQPDSYYQSLAGPDWSSITYANGGTDPIEPDPNVVTPDPDPVVVTEEPDPDPVVVDPVVVDPTPEPDPVFFAPSPTPDPVVVTPPTQDTGSMSSPSKLLNVYLADTDTDTVVTQLSEGTDVDGGLTAGRALTIFAETQEGSPDIGSVRINIPGFGSRMENVEPYAVFGDKNGDFGSGKMLDDGTYSVTMTAFEGRNGSGEILETFTFDFTVDGSATAPVDPVVVDPAPVDPVVVDPAPVDPVVVDPVVVTLPPETNLQRDAAPLSADSELINISLVDTGTDKVVSDLYQGIKLSSNDLGGRKLSISAEAIDPGSAGIGSMKLEMDGQYTNIENVTPYALFGDNKGNFGGGIELSDGTHFATLTAYSGKSGKGSVLEKVTVQFEIGDYDSVIVGGTSSAVTSYSSAQDKGTATVSENQMSVELEGSAWKSLNHFKQITEMTVMKVDFKSAAEGEIQGIGFSNGQDDLSSTFFQLDGSQELGIQAFNDQYEMGSGSDTYIIPVGQFFTGEFDELVLINDDDAGLGASSAFENISFFEAVA